METPPSHGGACDKLRLMISYGGHIVPRPHDKSLFYAGGETRLIAISRKLALSISSLTTHLLKSFQFPISQTLTLKYQLPDNDFDSLISISTDEDVANMLDEYDRLAASPTPSRIRFFLFCGGSDGGEGGGGGGLKTEEWFIDALRSAGVKRELPETISMEDRDGDREREREREDSSFGSNSSSSFPPVVRVCGGGGSGSDCGGAKVVLPSVDSLGSDSSIPSPNFSQQSIVYQDASYPELKVVSTNLVENESNLSDRSPQSDMLTPVQVSGYILSKPIDPPPQVPSPPPPSQHYIHHQAPQTHYVNQYFPNSIPVASYPSMYQPYVQSQQPVQYHQMNKPYPMYMMPVGQAQNPYGHNQAQNPYGHNQAQMAQNPVMVASHMVYEGYKPMGPGQGPDYGSQVYRAPVMATQPATGGTDDSHHQVMAFPPQNPPSQPVLVSPLETANYVSEYEDAMHAQIYKSQPTGPTLPSQVQTTTMGETVMLSESLAQLQVENTKQ